MSFDRRRFLATSALLAPVGSVALLGGCSEQRTAVAFKGIDITGAPYGRELNLPDVTGKPRSLAEFKGSVAIVFFGFAQCPDVCPTTLAEIAEVKRLLGADGRRVQGIFVTVDPARDTPEVLAAYVANFGDGFVALRGTPEQTAAAAKDFKVYFAKVPGKAPGSYTIDHTAGAYVFDPQGRVRLFVRHGGGVEAMKADVAALLRGA